MHPLSALGEPALLFWLLELPCGVLGPWPLPYLQGLQVASCLCHVASVTESGLLLVPLGATIQPTTGSRVRALGRTRVAVPEQGSAEVGWPRGVHRKALKYWGKKVMLLKAEQGKDCIRVFHRRLVRQGLGGLEKRGQQPGLQCVGFFLGDMLCSCLEDSWGLCLGATVHLSRGDLT